MYNIIYPNNNNPLGGARNPVKRSGRWIGKTTISRNNPFNPSRPTISYNKYILINCYTEYLINK